MLLWSTVAAAFKLTLRYLSAEELVWWASWVSCSVLCMLVAVSGRLRALGRYLRAHWRDALVLGMINPFVYYWTLFGAYERLPAQEAQAINYTWALVLMFLSVPILGHRLRRRDIFAGVLGYLGVYILATHGEVFGMKFTDPSGVGLALLSTVLWALYWILSTRISADTLVIQTANFGVGVVAMSVWFWWQGIAMEIPSAAAAVGIVYVGLFEMSVTFVLWGRALALTPRTATVSNLIYLSPILSLVLIHLLVGETILPSTVAALGLILTGLFVQHRGPEEGGLLD